MQRMKQLEKLIIKKEEKNERTQRLNHFIIAWHYPYIRLELRNLLGVGEEDEKDNLRQT